MQRNCQPFAGLCIPDPACTVTIADGYPATIGRNAIGLGEPGFPSKL